jgi:hypothetical protein
MKRCIKAVQSIVRRDPVSFKTNTSELVQKCLNQESKRKVPEINTSNFFATQSRPSPASEKLQFLREKRVEKYGKTKSANEPDVDDIHRHYVTRSLIKELEQTSPPKKRKAVPRFSDGKSGT